MCYHIQSKNKVSVLCGVYFCHTLCRGHCVFLEYIPHTYDVINNMYKNVTSVIKYSKTELSNHFHINKGVKGDMGGSQRVCVGSNVNPVYCEVICKPR